MLSKEDKLKIAVKFKTPINEMDKFELIDEVERQCKLKPKGNRLATVEKLDKCVIDVHKALVGLKVNEAVALLEEIKLDIILNRGVVRKGIVGIKFK